MIFPKEIFIFFLNFWGGGFGVGGSPPWSSSGYTTGRHPIIYDLQYLLTQTYKGCLTLLFK